MISEKKINKFKMYYYLTTLVIIIILCVWSVMSQRKKHNSYDYLTSLSYNDDEFKGFFPPDLVPHISPPLDDSHNCPYGDDCPNDKDTCPLKDIC